MEFSKRNRVVRLVGQDLHKAQQDGQLANISNPSNQQDVFVVNLARAMTEWAQSLVLAEFQRPYDLLEPETISEHAVQVAAGMGIDGDAWDEFYAKDASVLNLLAGLLMRGALEALVDGTNLPNLPFPCS